MMEMISQTDDGDDNTWKMEWRRSSIAMVCSRLSPRSLHPPMPAHAKNELACGAKQCATARGGVLETLPPLLPVPRGSLRSDAL
jgi:hypothetical protein